MVERRDVDLTRVRDARDAFQAEITERKAKEAELVNGISQTKILANARAVRVCVFANSPLADLPFQERIAMLISLGSPKKKNISPYMI